MQVTCVKAFGALKPGDVAEVPDGAAVDPEHFGQVAAEPARLTEPPRVQADAADQDPAKEM